MDPLSITVSAITLSKVVCIATKVARQLYHVARSSGDLEDEVQFFAAQVDFFASMISNTSSTIQNYLEKYEKSAFLEELGSKPLDSLASQANYLLRRIQSVKKKVPWQRKSVSYFLESWKWLLNAAKREEICLGMERIKSSLQLVMIHMNLEALLYKIQSPDLSPQKLKELKREIKDQKRLIKAQMQTIEVLQFRHHTKYYEQLRMHEKSYIEQSFTMDDVLLDIGNEVTIAENLSNLSPLSSTDGYTNDANVAVEENHIDDDDDYFSDGDGHALELAISSSESHSDGEAYLPPQAPVSPQLLPRSLHMVRKSSSVSSECSELAPQPLQPSCSSTQGEDHYEAVRSSSNLLFLEPAMETRAAAGYVNEQRIIAKVFPTFPENIISQALAVRLGLEVVLHNDEDHVKQIDIGRGYRQATIGTTRLTWSFGMSAHTFPHTLSVLCYVCDNVTQPLIFGKSFLDRQNTYIHHYNKLRLKTQDNGDIHQRVRDG